MARIRRQLAAFAALVLSATAGVTLVAATPAYAVSCGSTSSIDLHADIPATQTVVSISYQGPRQVALWLTNARGSDRSHATLRSASGTGIELGDRVWVQWRNTPSSPWESC